LSRVLHEKQVDRETSRQGDPKASNQKKGSGIRESVDKRTWDSLQGKIEAG
jgi:hypothetical protein